MITTKPAILERLEGVRQTGETQWEARCPAHEDRKPSLCIGAKSDGRTLVKCQAGCSAADVVGAVGLNLKDLFAPTNGYRNESTKAKPRTSGRGKIAATYDYRDDSGAMLFQAVRFEPKDFRQRAPKPGGGWNWSLEGIRRVPYRLPELIAADPSQPVFVVEGERDVDRLMSLGLVATCNPMGAGKWRPEFNQYLAGRHVRIIADNDEPGRIHGNDVARNVYPVAASVRVIQLPKGTVPDGGDISDWLDIDPASASASDVLTLAECAADWTPPPEPPADLDDEPMEHHEDNAQPEDQPQDDSPKFTFFTAEEFAALDLRRDYHIPGILAAGPVPTVMAGAFKTMKTSIAVDLSLSLAMQHRFLGEFGIPRRVRVAIMSGESGGFALQNMAERISHSKGWTLRGAGDWWNICPALPTLTRPDHIVELERFINDRAIEVFIVDPTYLAMKGLDDAGNIFTMGAQLEPLVRMGERTGCTVVIVHHNTRASMRNIGEPAELADIAWSGFAEIAGQWILLARREKYEPDSEGDHKLWLTAGGRDGHSTLVAVDIAEGRQDSPQGRTWDVSVGKASAARAEAAEAAAEEQEERKAVKEQRKAESDREKVKAALAKRGPSTISDIGAAVKMNHQRTKTALYDLEELGDVVACEITKRNKQKYDGFQLSTQVHPDSPGLTPTDSDLSGCPTAEPLHPDNSPIGGCRSGDGVGGDDGECE